jgi:hypothetical protein
MSEVRAYVFRKQAFDAENRACRPHVDEATRRTWLIVAREWTKMAEKEEAELDAERAAGDAVETRTG